MTRFSAAADWRARTPTLRRASPSDAMDTNKFNDPGIERRRFIAAPFIVSMQVFPLR